MSGKGLVVEDVCCVRSGVFGRDPSCVNRVLRLAVFVGFSPIKWQTRSQQLSASIVVTGLSRHGRTCPCCSISPHETLHQLKQTRGVDLWIAVQCFWFFLAGNRILRSQRSRRFPTGKSRKPRSQTSSTPNINPLLTATARTWPFWLIAPA